MKIGNWKISVAASRRDGTLPPMLKPPRPPAALSTILERSRCESVTICAIRQPCLLLSTARPAKHAAVPMARRRDVPWIVPHFCNFILHFRSFIFPVRTSFFEKLGKMHVPRRLFSKWKNYLEGEGTHGRGIKRFVRRGMARGRWNRIKWNRVREGYRRNLPNFSPR